MFISADIREDHSKGRTFQRGVEEPWWWPIKELLPESRSSPCPPGQEGSAASAKEACRVTVSQWLCVAFVTFPALSLSKWQCLLWLFCSCSAFAYWMYMCVCIWSWGGRWGEEMKLLLFFQIWDLCTKRRHIQTLWRCYHTPGLGSRCHDWMRLWNTFRRGMTSAMCRGSEEGGNIYMHFFFYYREMNRL